MLAGWCEGSCKTRIIFVRVFYDDHYGSEGAPQ